MLRMRSHVQARRKECGSSVMGSASEEGSQAPSIDPHHEANQTGTKTPSSALPRSGPNSHSVGNVCFEALDLTLIL